MKPTIRLGVLASFAAALVLAAACSSSGTTTATKSPPPASTASTPSSTGTTHAAETGTMSAPGVATAAAGGLTGMLGSHLGLTSDQASGAVGSVLSLAQEKLQPSDYTQVASAVPGASSYVQKAKDVGAVTGPIGDVSGLNASYSKLGISPEVASQVTPLITQYVSAANPTAGGLLSSVLK
jgi:hypothetical protein